MNLMKKCLIAIFLSSALFAQVEFEFYGYWVNMPIYTKLPGRIASELGTDKNQFTDINRFRLKPTLYLWSGGKLSLEHEIVTSFYNNSTGLLAAETSNSSRQITDLKWIPGSGGNYKFLHFVDRLYFRQNFESSNLIIGRQRISWGTGRIWNPTDLFNPVNPADFTKIEKDGADAISYQYNIASFTDIELVYNPADHFNKNNYAARFRTNVSEYDISIIGGSFDNHPVTGFDFAGNLYDAGLRGEFIASMDKNFSTDYIKFIAGIDYQFNQEFYGLTEYQFNGQGKTSAAEYEIEKLSSASIISLAQNYICLSINYQYTPLTMITLTDITNIDDGSGFVSGDINYSLTENFYISAGLQFSYGETGSEYWYYGNSIYLKTEYYF